MLVSSRPNNTTDFTMKLQDVCDGLTQEQLKVRQQQQDLSVWLARERALSAKSRSKENFSARNRSRLSSVTDRREHEEDQRSVTDFSQDAHSNRTTPDPYSGQNKNPIMLLSPRGPYAYVSKAQTLPDIEMRRAEQQFLLDDQGSGSYSSINNGIIIPRRKLCNRSKSAIGGRSAYGGNYSCLSRQCCDVLGPKVCRECALIKRKIFDSCRYERPLTRLEVSERNFADSITLSRTLPDVPLDEIEDKVISGDILRASLRQRLLIKRERTLLDNAKSKATPIKERPKTAWNGVSNTFFMNIRDLHNKILIGTLTNTLHKFENTGKPTNTVKDNKCKSLVPVTPTPGGNNEQRQKRVMYYEPPLVPRVCQSTEPAFYAGSSDGYKLPDRLPDKVVEDQIDDFSAFEASWSQSGSSRTQSETEAVEPATQTVDKVDETDQSAQNGEELREETNETTDKSEATIQKTHEFIEKVKETQTQYNKLIGH